MTDYVNIALGRTDFSRGCILLIPVLEYSFPQSLQNIADMVTEISSELITYLNSQVVNPDTSVYTVQWHRSRRLRLSQTTDINVALPL
jgi:hypothetical protein